MATNSRRRVSTLVRGRRKHWHTGGRYRPHQRVKRVCSHVFHSEVCNGHSRRQRQCWVEDRRRERIESRRGVALLLFLLLFLHHSFGGQTSWRRLRCRLALQELHKQFRERLHTATTEIKIANKNTVTQKQSFILLLLSLSIVLDERLTSGSQETRTEQQLTMPHDGNRQCGM